MGRAKLGATGCTVFDLPKTDFGEIGGACWSPISSYKPAGPMGRLHCSCYIRHSEGHRLVLGLVIDRLPQRRVSVAIFASQAGV